MFNTIKQWFRGQPSDADVQAHIEALRAKAPIPVFWFFGKTQSGKTSIIKYLTGAEDAEIGQGFKPCTRFSRMYEFPTHDAPLLTFLDTRGVDEPGYDPHEDLARFDALAHVVLVTVKALDHAQERVLRHLQTLRASQPQRPIVLAATCLHEAYPQQQHPHAYESIDWGDGAPPANGSERALPAPDLATSLAEQRTRFAGVYDDFVPIDLTPAEEGFHDPNYGGPRLKEALLRALPAAQRQTLLTLDEGMRGLQDMYARRALPYISGYASLAATAGAVPIPFVDLLIVPGIQTRMIYHLAQLYGQPLTGQRFAELSSTLGMGMLVRTAARQVAKFVPVIGSITGAALAGASTFALGKAFCYYYSAVHKGHVPQAAELKKYYAEQLAQAEKMWRGQKS